LIKQYDILNCRYKVKILKTPDLQKKNPERHWKPRSGARPQIWRHAGQIILKVPKTYRNLPNKSTLCNDILYMPFIKIQSSNIWILLQCRRIASVVP